MWAETRPHEAGFGSNRVSEARGESVPAPCTHRPSKHPSEVRMRPPCGGQIWASQGGLSRNKVAVEESAAGSPPKTGTRPTCLAHFIGRFDPTVGPSGLARPIRGGYPFSGFRVQLPEGPFGVLRFEPFHLSVVAGLILVRRSMHHPVQAWMGRVETRTPVYHLGREDDTVCTCDPGVHWTRSFESQR